MTPRLSPQHLLVEREIGLDTAISGEDLGARAAVRGGRRIRSEEHTSELQSPS